MSKTLTCPVCGATFTTTARYQVYCSRKCAKKHERARRRASDRKRRAQPRYNDAFSSSAPVTFAVLSKAKTRPANTSAVRWRMELRRRAMQRRFGKKNMDMLPHPDIV